MGSNMKKYLICLICLFMIAACSEYDPQKPVYDTAKNPDNFPDMAIALLEDIENENLVGYDTILATFAELYTQNNHLLDDKNWKEVIKKLGMKFRYRADSLAAAGITDFYPAAELYGLAAFALPDDTSLKTTERTFNVWKKAVDSAPLAALGDSLGTGLDFDRQLQLLRSFLIDDSLHYRFGRDYLAPALLGQYTPESPLEPSLVEKLSLPDKAFLNWLGAYFEPLDDKIIYFTEPVIDLVTAQISPLGDDWFTVEIYFIPRDTVRIDYTVAMRLNMARDVLPSGQRTPRLEVKPFDFYPVKPSTQWEIDKVAAAFHKFYCPGPKGLFSVGLLQEGTNPYKFNPVWKSGFNFYTLPDSVLKL